MSSRSYSRPLYCTVVVSLLLVSVFVAACNVGCVDAQGSWWNSSWSYRKMITIDHAKVSADLGDIPVLVDLIDTDLMSKSRSDGGDIVFTDYSGTKLNHEIESYDSGTGHLVCWVSTDLSSSTDTKLYIYYGNSGVSNQENPTAVWNSGYAMVQHLAETQASPASDWHKIEGNPVLNGSQNGFASVFYDNSSGIYHLYCSWGSILHFTSSNGKTGWTADPLNPMLAGNSEGVPMVWKEDGVWYMLYRYGGPDKIGLANSTDASHWTRYEGNPVINVGSFCDPWGVIKVGSTYYLWYNDGWGTGGRCAGLATSTDLKNWTQDFNNPIFTGGRFCVFPFKYDGYYHMLVPRYTTSPYGEIELYRDVNPTFYPTSREYLGVIIKPGPAGAWDDHRFDTPCVLTDTIHRDSYQASNNELWTYYAGTGTPTGSGADWWTGMCIEQNITNALTRIGANIYSNFDSTANHNNGQASGNLEMNVTGKIDGADKFDGVNSYINCGNGDSLKGMMALTVETWVKPDLLPPGGTGIVAKWNSWAAGSGGSYILWQGSAGTVGWGVITETSTAYFYNTSVLQPGQWYHIVGTYDGSQIRLYINGALAGAPTSITGRIASTNDPCYVGRYTTPYFNGTIDEVRISNVSRSVDWILTEYNNQLNPSTFYSVGFEETQVRAEFFVTPSLTDKRPEDVGTTFAVNVTVRNVTDLFGFDFNLTWEGNLISLVGVDYESLLDAIWGSGGWFLVKNETGQGWYKLVALSTSSGFSSSGVQALLKLTFLVETTYGQDAQTAIHFGVAKLSDSNGQPIAAGITDGNYRMIGVKPTIRMNPANMLCRKYSENFTVTVSVADVYNATDFQFEIHYNATLLECINVMFVSWPSGAVILDGVSGNLTGYTEGDPISGNTTILRMTFRASYYHIWKKIAGWTNDLSSSIYFQWVNLSYPSGPDLGYVRGGLNQINVGADVNYAFSPIQGDVNNDGVVDIFDIRTVAAYYDVKESDPLWMEASKYDLTRPTGENVVDIYDIVVLALNYGFTCG